MTATADASEALPAEDYSELLDRVFDDRVTKWTAEAEETERFPRKLIEYLGESGVFAAKWPVGQQQSDVAKVIALARKLGVLGSAGIGVGVGLHDSAIAILRRFGKSDYLKDIAEQAIRGEAVLCIGASEQSGGSDLQIVGTEVRPCGTASRSRASRSSCRCPPSPTTSWPWPATSTTTRTASTAA